MSVLRAVYKPIVLLHCRRARHPDDTNRTPFHRPLRGSVEALLTNDCKQQQRAVTATPPPGAPPWRFQAACIPERWRDL